ncbi:MAG TPA: IMP cyclohydrolase [Candidatus Aminicenantes bacterium]|nr:IMP cyclohydrolase [Candidatus Aminicenantes bacterium]
MDPQRIDMAALEYPGRVIVIGAAPSGRAAVVYAITGRSPSSQARKLVHRDGGVWVEPTDEAALKTGNVDLLVYPALLFSPGGVAVSNGKQTADVRDWLRPGLGPVPILSAALAGWDFEPDAPIFTPRISGCLAASGAALGVVRRGPSGETLRSFFEVRLRAGEGRLVSTYEGPNADPLPVFRGEPRFVDLVGSTAAETAAACYGALGPAAEGRDFRVAVAVVFLDPAAPDRSEVRVINRHERT